MPQRCVVGVDLGGTNVRACAYLDDGTEASPRVNNPSHAQEGNEAIFDAVARTVGEVVRTSSVAPEGIGLAVPGHIDDSAGTVRWSPNFGEHVNGVFNYWKDVPVRAPLRRHLDLPIHMGNDANLAALGEYKFGSGKGRAKCLVMLTLGTGIGGGVVLSPRSVLGDANGPLVLVGGNGGGGELGHVIINSNGADCNAGTYGAIEAYCRRDAIVQRAVHRLKRNRPSLLTEMVEGDLSRVSPLLITTAAERGDELAIEVYSEVGTMLGIAIGNFINVFAPDLFVIGGQIAKAGHWLLDPAIKSARNVAVMSLFEDCEIRLAEQIEDAGMLGGAALAFEALKWGDSD